MQDDTVAAPSALVQVGALLQAAVIFRVQDVSLLVSLLPQKLPLLHISNLKTAFGRDCPVRVLWTGIILPPTGEKGR